ncbi:MAG: YaeQ family protein [Gallionella sp.]|nr:YaeQ family protein [Gallionella sp.]MDD4945547.1 YaeQ family protein [Gallionella sp.]MDD5612209.1 YaeQ family protein [Gallionella sp.]
MAIKSIIFKAQLQIADMDRYYYADHALTVALHPSETEERMMVRMVAFAIFADEALVFGKGLSDDDEPDLWQKDLTGAVERWIMVGLPDERLIRKATGRARQVVVCCYGRTADMWWNDNHSKLSRLDNLTVLRLPVESTQALKQLVSRTMQLQCTIQESHIMMTSEGGMVEIEPEIWQGSLPSAQT